MFIFFLFSFFKFIYSCLVGLYFSLFMLAFIRDDASWVKWIKSVSKSQCWKKLMDFQLGVQSCVKSIFRPCKVLRPIQYNNSNHDNIAEFSNRSLIKTQVGFLQKRNPILGLQCFEKYSPNALKKKIPYYYYYASFQKKIYN